MSKGKSKTVQTQQATAPWGDQQNYLLDVFKRAHAQTNAPTSEYTTSAIQRRAAEANNPNSLTNQGQEQYAKTLRGDYLNSNPYMDATVNRALGQTRAAVNAGFQGDSYGNSAHQEWLANKLSETAFPYYMQNYENERGRQLNAAQQAPTMANADIAQLQQAGAMEDNMGWEDLAKYQAAVSGGYGGETYGTQPYYGGNDMANMMGLGLMAYGAFK